MARQTDSHGALIAFEGIDGCGKSTQAKLLHDHLLTNDVPCLLVREPGTTPTAEAVREILLHRSENPVSPEAELFLYLAARADLYRQVILPALDEGAAVISDRFFWSTVAYQGEGLDLGMDRARALSLLATGGREPDFVFLFDLPLEEARKRRAGAADRIEARGGPYLDRVRAAFLALAEGARDTTRVLDGTRSIESLHAEVARTTEALLRGQ